MSELSDTTRQEIDDAVMHYNRAQFRAGREDLVLEGMSYPSAFGFLVDRDLIRPRRILEEIMARRKSGLSSMERGIIIEALDRAGKSGQIFFANHPWPTVKAVIRASHGQF